MDVHMLLPHEVLHCLATSSSEAIFQSVCLGNLDGPSRAEFWEHLRSLAPWRSHPCLNDERFEPERLVPLTFHMDGAQMFREDEYVVWSFSSCFNGSGLISDCLLFQFPFCILPDKHLISKNVSQLN